MQIEVVKALARGQIQFLDFAHRFFYPGYNSLSAHLQTLTDKMLSPMLRDIERLAEDRLLPPIVLEKMGMLPPSGDAVLDSLLAQACRQFRESDPDSRAISAPANAMPVEGTVVEGGRVTAPSHSAWGLRAILNAKGIHIDISK